MIKLYSDPSYVNMMDFVKQYEDWRRWLRTLLEPRPLNPVKSSLYYYSIINHEKLDGPLGELGPLLPLYTYNQDKEIFIVHRAVATHILENHCWQTEELGDTLRDIEDQVSLADKKIDQDYRQKLQAAEQVINDLEYNIDPCIIMEEHEYYRMSHSYNEGCMSLDRYKETYVSKLRGIVQDIIDIELNFE